MTYTNADDFMKKNGCSRAQFKSMLFFAQQGITDKECVRYCAHVTNQKTAEEFLRWYISR